MNTYVNYYIRNCFCLLLGVAVGLLIGRRKAEPKGRGIAQAWMDDYAEKARQSRQWGGGASWS